MMVQIYNFFSEQSDKTQKTLYNRIKKMSAARIRKTRNGDMKGVLWGSTMLSEFKRYNKIIIYSILFGS